MGVGTGEPPMEGQSQGPVSHCLAWGAAGWRAESPRRVCLDKLFFLLAGTGVVERINRNHMKYLPSPSYDPRVEVFRVSLSSFFSAGHVGSVP